MITASKARLIAQKNEKSIQVFFDAIESASKDGLYTTRVDVSKLSSDEFISVKYRLVKLGFSCNRFRDSLLISWIDTINENNI